MDARSSSALTSLPRFRNVHRLQYANFVFQVRNTANEAMGRCKTLLPDVVVPEVHQNDRSCVRELSGRTFGSLCKNLASWAVTRSISKTTKLSKLEGGCLHGGGHLDGGGHLPVTRQCDYNLRWRWKSLGGG